MPAWRFQIVFDKIRELTEVPQPGLVPDATDEDLLRETEEIAELKRLALDLGEVPETSYTTT